MRSHNEPLSVAVVRVSYPDCSAPLAQRRLAPNTISALTQSPSSNIGRYSLMGDLNLFSGFRQPATGCN